MDDLIPPAAATAVWDWAEGVYEENFDQMWLREDRNLRLCEAQLWVHANQEFEVVSSHNRDDLANDLARLSSGSPLRGEFERGRLRANRELLPERTVWESWGVASFRRQVGEDLDVIIMLDPSIVGDQGAFEQDTLVSGADAAVFLTRSTDDGWRVAGFDYNPPIPGWPPTVGTPTDIVDR